MRTGRRSIADVVSHRSNATKDGASGAGVLTAVAVGYYFTVYNSDGCDEVGSLMRPQDTWPPDEGDLRGIEFSFEVKSDETVQLRLTQRNVSNETISFTADSGSPNFMIVAATSCDEVWVWRKIVLPVTSDGELGPHEERVWAVEVGVT